MGDRSKLNEEFVLHAQWDAYARMLEKDNMKRHRVSLTFSGIARRANRHIIYIDDSRKGMMVRPGWREAMRRYRIEKKGDELHFIVEGDPAVYVVRKNKKDGVWEAVSVLKGTTDVTLAHYTNWLKRDYKDYARYCCERSLWLLDGGRGRAPEFIHPATRDVVQKPVSKKS